MSKDQISPHEGASYRLDAPVVSQRDGVLRADDFDDLYFDLHDGLAESQYVFINGTRLREKLAAAALVDLRRRAVGGGAFAVVT